MTTPEAAPEGATQPASGATDPLARALDVAIYAPIGAAALAVDVAPELLRTVVARGRAEVEVRQEQVARRIRHAKGAGEVAIAFGLPVLRRKVEQRIASLRPSPPPASKPRPRPEPATPRRVTVTPTAAAPTAPIAPADTNGRGDPDTLAIPGYDALSASQVVERLAGLSRDELAAVHDYETGHRRRRTILGKIEQLSS
jgi:hypothetical protein